MYKLVTGHFCYKSTQASKGPTCSNVVICTVAQYTAHHSRASISTLYHSIWHCSYQCN